jgi:hypothetical protein
LDLKNLTVDIPEELTADEISVYLWYPGKGMCYFDDLTITGFELK